MDPVGLRLKLSVQETSLKCLIHRSRKMFSLNCVAYTAGTNLMLWHWKCKTLALLRKCRANATREVPKSCME